MNERQTQLESDLKKAQARVEQGVAAGSFLQTTEGKLIQDWINERVSYLMEKMTSKTPLTSAEYQSCHGGVRELKDFNIMLQSKANAGISAKAEVDELNGQLKAELGLPFAGESTA